PFCDDACEARTERLLCCHLERRLPSFVMRNSTKGLSYLTAGRARESRANRDSNVPSCSEGERIQTSLRSPRWRKLGATATGTKEQMSLLAIKIGPRTRLGRQCNGCAIPSS